MRRSSTLLLAFLLAACDGEDCPDLTGDWTLDVTDVTSSCGPEEDWSSSLAITQAGCEATQVDVVGIKGDTAGVTGSIDGDVITIAGSFDDSGGVTELTLTVTRQSDAEFTGTEDWQWFASASDEEPTCTDGTASVSLTLD